MLIGTGVAVATGEVVDHTVFLAVAGIAFLLMFVASLALGISLLRRAELRLAAWTLTSIIAALGLAILLGAIGAPGRTGHTWRLASFGHAFIALAPRHVQDPPVTADTEPATGQRRLARNPS